MFCSGCGNKIGDDSSFCSHCGQIISSMTSNGRSTVTTKFEPKKDTVSNVSKSVEISKPYSSSKPNMGEWKETAILCLVGFVLFVATNSYIDHEISESNNPIWLAIIDFSGLFFFVVIPAVIIGIITGKAVKKYRKFPTAILVKKAFWVAAAALALLTYGNYSLYESRHRQESASIVKGGKAPVTAAITRQQAREFADVWIDQQLLFDIENWYKDIVSTKLSNQYSELGLNPFDLPEISSQASIIEVQSKELAIVKIHWHNSSMVAVFGIDGDELIRVSCNRNSDHEITIFFGPCGEKIYEAFGVMFAQ